MHEGCLLHKMKKTISACCQFLSSFFCTHFFRTFETDFAAVFARDPGWQQDCRGVEQLPAKIPDVPFNPGQIQIGKIQFTIWNKILARPLAYTRQYLGLPYKSTKIWTICEVFIWDTLYHNYLICPSLTSGPTSFWGTQTVFQECATVLK